MIAWLILLPVCELPWTAVCPVPRPLFPFVGASDPKDRIPPVAQLTQDKLIYGFRGDRSQVTSLLLAGLLSLKPVLLLLAPEVAVVSLSLPARRAGDNAGGFATGSIT